MKAAAVGFALLVVGCSGAVFQAGDIEFERAGDKTTIRDETGAIIVGKRHVGDVRGTKIVNSKGQPLAFLYDDNVRLKGGIQLPIRSTADGTIFVPASAQEKAGLSPMRLRVRADGRVASTEGAQGLPSKGATTAAKRRQLLVVLLLTAHDMW